MFKPLNNYVLIQRIEEENKTAGGIIIPDTAKEKPQNVLSSGAGCVILGRMERTRFAQTTFHLFLPRITQPLKTPSCGMFFQRQR